MVITRLEDVANTCQPLRTLSLFVKLVCCLLHLFHSVLMETDSQLKSWIRLTHPLFLVIFVLCDSGLQCQGRSLPFQKNCGEVYKCWRNKYHL